MKSSTILVFALVFLCGATALPTIAPAGIDCGNGLSCASGQTCLSNATGAGELMACSPFPNAVFCHDARFSCPAGTSCGAESKCTAADGSVIADATINADAYAVAEFRNFGAGMVEVKNVVCRLRLPGICSCAPSGRIGATVTCQVGIPLSGLTIGASAHILPCGDPASFGYRAWAGNRELANRQWTATFSTNMPLPAPPAGFSIGIASVTTRAEISGAVRRGRLTANLALGVCGKFMFVGSCCNTDCPFPMSRAPLPVNLITGTYDFSDLC